MSGFSGLNTAVSGLLAHRRRIDIIAHNLANSATEGYSRQRVELGAAGSTIDGGIFTTSTIAQGGVHIVGTFRITDELLERQALRERSTSSFLDGRVAALEVLEHLVPEPAGSGVTGLLDATFNAFDDVANDPGAGSLRAALLGHAGSLTAGIRRIGDGLVTRRRDLLAGLQAQVEQINSLAAELAGINNLLVDGSIAGDPPNDMLDNRDRALNALAELADVDVTFDEFGRADVLLDGRALVRGPRAKEIVVAEVPDAALAPLGMGRFEIQMAGTGSPLVVAGGAVGGALSVANTDLPDHLEQLDDFTAQLVTAVNALHQTGQALDGSTGLDFFDPAGVTARTIAISADVADQPDKIAAALSTAGPFDGEIAARIAAIGDDPDGPGEALRSFVTSMGTVTAVARQQATVQQAVLFEVDQARQATKGVNLDEEMADLVASQHAYDAAARLLTVIDQMLDTLINRTGLAGR